MVPTLLRTVHFYGKSAINRTMRAGIMADCETKKCNIKIRIGLCVGVSATALAYWTSGSKSDPGAFRVVVDLSTSVYHCWLLMLHWILVWVLKNERRFLQKFREFGSVSIMSLMHWFIYTGSVYRIESVSKWRFLFIVHCTDGRRHIFSRLKPPARRDICYWSYHVVGSLPLETVHFRSLSGSAI